MKIILLFFSLLLTNIAWAQLLKVVAGTDLTILSGTIFRTEDLTLTPSANFTISDNTLTKSTTIAHSATNTYISRVYQFTNNTSPYSGSLQINYTDGAELNSITEGALTLNIYNGSGWNPYAATITRDGTNNFILTNGLSSVVLSELTLADLASPLPLVWLSFSATKQNQTALLQWATAQEHNTRNFSVQQSNNGMNWAEISTLPAIGNSNIVNHYDYVHNTPATGLNYYRILQTDMDNQHSYSDVKALSFTSGGAPFIITGNPVTNNVLTLQVNRAAIFGLYTADGKLLWQEQLHTGTRSVDVSRYAKGIYLLKTNATTQKVAIQ